MLPTQVIVLIGVLFVLLAVGAVWLMFDGLRSAPQSDRARRMIRALAWPGTSLLRCSAS